MEKPSIFISYSSKDRQTAEIIHEKLGSSGLDVWRDKTRLETDWSREIAQALADSDVLCLLWSKHAAQSKWVKHEWLTARALEKTIILCRLPEAPVSPEPLHNLQEVNLENPEKGSQDLIGRLESRQDFTKKYDYTVLPKNSYIPFNPNRNFTGRGQDLLELYLKLIGNLNKIGINQVGTVGMGGIGKTQLVVEFAYRFSFAFDGIYWIQAADEGEWLDQFVELARDRLQLSINVESDKPEADKQYIYALQKYCKENPDTLIIMDNVAEPKLLNSDSFLFGLTPLTLGCDLLFTTRKHFELPGVSSQPVNILFPDPAYRLLTSYREPHTPDEAEQARFICNAVGYLPLAIVLVGAYLKAYRLEIQFLDYHGELLINKLDTIDIGKISEEDLATRHEAAVTTTLKSQWEMLDDEDARTLFKLAGQFTEAEIIPKARLGLLAGIGPGKSKLDQPLSNAFNLLQNLNLVEKLEGDSSAIRLHPLVRAFARRLLPEQQRATFKSTAAENLEIAVFDYSRLQNELDKRGIRQLLGDIEVAIDWWGDDKRSLRAMRLLQGALRLSFNQLSRDANRLITQLLGRLTSRKEAEIKMLLEQAATEKKGVWLRPLTPSLTPAGVSLIRTLKGHSRWVTAVAIAPDGKTAVSASEDHTLKVWELRSGDVLKTLEGHNDWVKDVAITPDGKKAVSASADATLKVWDLHAGKLLKTLKGHSEAVTFVAIAPDGKTAVSASDDHTLKVWDLRSGELLQTLEGDSGWVTAVAIAPDGKTAVSVSDNRTLEVWDLKSGEVFRTLEGHSDSITALAIAQDGKTAVSGSYDHTLKVWDLRSGELRQTLKGHSKAVTAVAIAPDGKTAVSASWDKTLKVWDLRSGELRQTLKGRRGYADVVAIARDVKTAVLVSDNRTLEVWDLKSGEVFRTLEGHSDSITALAIAQDGKTAVSGSYDHTLKVWDLHAGKVLQRTSRLSHMLSRFRFILNYLKTRVKMDFFFTDGGHFAAESRDSYFAHLTLEGHSDSYVDHLTLESHSGSVTAVAIAPDGMTAVSGSLDDTLKVWDLHTGEVFQTLEGHSDWVKVVAIAPDGKIAVSASESLTLKVWDLRSGEVLQTLEGHSRRTTAVVIAPDGKTAVSASNDETLKVWDLDAGKRLQTLKGHSDLVKAVAITPDGKKAVSASADATLKVWDLQSGEVLNTLEGHSEGVTSVAIAPDGKTAVSGSLDDTLKVWDLYAGKVLQTLEGHSGNVTAVVIALDGKTVVSASDDATLNVWDLRSGGVRQTLRVLSGSAVAIASDGKTAVSASDDGTLKVWDLRSGMELADFCGDGRIDVFCVSLDGKTIVAGEDGGRMHFLRMEGMS